MEDLGDEKLALMALLLRENIIISLRSVRSHLLRTVLTILIIAIGITALVGILTAIEAVKGSIYSNFTSMGANTFKIRNRGMFIHIGSGGKEPKQYRPITYDEAIRFEREYPYPSVISISTRATETSTVKFGNSKTHPNVTIMGSDEHFLLTAGYAVEAGRNFSWQEVYHGRHVAIIGTEIVKKLFPGKKAGYAFDKIISIGAGRYRVIGVLDEKGSGMGFGGDNVCIIPLTNCRQHFSRKKMSFIIDVLVDGPEHLDPAIGEAISLMRVVRKVAPGKEENFEITRSDNLAQVLVENIRFVTYAATAIGIITLLGAAIGLMNIMLVSVNERTREIGIRKTAGATRQTIGRQFLAEAIVICQLGGIIGIILGILAGNGMSLLLSAPFIIPWVWVGSGVVLCLIVGTLSGLYPAIKAARQDPIEALRYE